LRLSNNHICPQISDQGLCHLSHALKNLVLLRAIFLNFAEYIFLLLSIIDSFLFARCKAVTDEAFHCFSETLQNHCSLQVLDVNFSRQLNILVKDEFITHLDVEI